MSRNLMNAFSPKLWSIVAILVAMVSMALAAPADAGGERHKPAAIVGVVALEDGTVVADANVRLVNEKGNVVDRTRTGPKGGFEFKPVRPGRYLVQGGKKDVGRGEEKVIAKPGEVAKVKITLKK
jgi:Carboxypeptidase regulatory-like domain